MSRRNGISIARRRVGVDGKGFMVRSMALIENDEQETDPILCQVKGEESSRNEVGLARGGPV
jgi:hypothetical protein